MSLYAVANDSPAVAGIAVLPTLILSEIPVLINITLKWHSIFSKWEQWNSSDIFIPFYFAVQLDKAGYYTSGTYTEVLPFFFFVFFYSNIPTAITAGMSAK